MGDNYENVQYSQWEQWKLYLYRDRCHTPTGR